MPSERILFVDDDPVSRRAFARAMRKSGFIVDLAQNGDEAWELASHFPYAVIATDLRMPGMDGMMLIDQLKELQPDPVCLLVTGCEQLEWYRESGDAGVDVIQKPWNGDQLAEALRQAVREYRSRVRTLVDSERPRQAGVREVVAIGFTGAQRSTLVRGLGDGYRVLSANTVDAAVDLLRARTSASCCFVPDGPASAAALRRLSRVSPQTALILMGSGEPEVAAVEALRKGAQDWLPLEGLDQLDLVRAVVMASERLKAGAGPLPVCTEVSNPGLLYDRFRQATSRAKRFTHQAALLLVDIDRFGDINASLGYSAGDELLALVAERLRSSVRESDAVLRLGQDEFALVLEDLGSIDSLDIPAQRVLNSFATPFRCGGHEIVLTASIGGAVYPTHGHKARDLMRRAESALEQAKRDGRNRYCTYSEPSSVVGPQGAAAHLN